MKNLSLSGRVLASVSLLGFAVAAQAVQFDIMSHGNYSQTPGVVSVSEVVIYQNFVPAMPALSTLNYSVNTGTLIGAGTYTNGVDSLNFTFQYTTDIPVDGFSSTVNAHAQWIYTSGTGAFAGLYGSGVFATNFNPLLGQTTLTELSGRLESVPEPATIAVLGIGLAAALRRRKA